MLVLLPALGLLLTIALGAGLSDRVPTPARVRRGILVGVALMAALVVAVSEGIGKFGGLSVVSLGILWLTIISFSAIWGWRSGSFAHAMRHLRIAQTGLRSWPPLQLIILGLLLLELSLLLLIAVKSPPNTVDSLQYHMARVAHWAQMGNLEHYAATYHPQLWNAIGAEVLVLQLYVLGHGHASVNLVQWASMLGAGVGITVIAADLGGSRRGQLGALVFGLTAPVTILQSTSTQTDLVAGFWIVTTAALALPVRQRDLSWPEWIGLGAAVGMGTMTKGTFYPYGLSLLALLVVLAIWNRRTIRRVGPGLLVVAAIAASLNFSYWNRNLKTYGALFGAPAWLESKTGAEIAPLAPLGRLLIQLGLELPTPSEQINAATENFVKTVSASLGASEPEYHIVWAWNHEDFAGSPIHLAAIAVFLILSTRIEDRTKKSALILWGVGVIVSFAAFSWLISFNPYGARHHLPFFLLSSPIIGVVLERWNRPGVEFAFSMSLLLLAVPWILFNQTRPLIALEGRTRVQSIFHASERELMFANAPDAREPYTQAAQAILDTGCLQVGTSLDSSDPEYALWWLLGAPSDSLEIESIRPLPSLSDLSDASFKPCAVFCTNCGERDEMEGLPILARFGRVSVFTEK